MDLRLRIVGVGEDADVYWLEVALLTGIGGDQLDVDRFRFAKQTKRILVNDVDPRPANWKPKLSVPRESNIFDYDLLVDISARQFLRRQELIGRNVAGEWSPIGWTKQQGPDLVLPSEAQRRVPFLSDRLVSMPGAELLVDAPDIAGTLRKLAARMGTVTTISAGFDGYRGTVPTCDDTGVVVGVGQVLTDTDFLRAYIRYSLSSLPSLDVITNTDVKLKVTVANGGGAVVDLQAYNQDGQADPEVDSCATRYTRCSDDASPYLNNNSTLQSTGVKTLTLPTAANTDIRSAKSAVGRFSIGINENTPTEDAWSFIEATENAGTDEPKLVLTHHSLAHSSIAAVII